MTTFRRKNPVNPGYHYVTRDEWGRSSWGHLTLRGRSDWLLRYIRTKGIEASKNLLIPNAICPECLEEVYFFKHHNGGCAWFDELGVPWDKHPCMDIEDTKCSSEWVAKQDEAESKEQEKARKEAARIALADWRAECRKGAVQEFNSYASRFFKPEFCKICNQNEYSFEFQNLTIGRFSSIGDSWKIAPCSVTRDGNFILNEFRRLLRPGEKWKLKTPSIYETGWASHGYKQYSSGSPHWAYYSMTFGELLKGYIENGVDIYASPKDENTKIYPLIVLGEGEKGSSNYLYTLRSLNAPKNNVVVEAGRSSSLVNGNLVFLEKRGEKYKLVYLSPTNGRRKSMSCKLVGLLSLNTDS